MSRLRQLDEDLFHAVAGRDTPVVDALLPRLSRLMDWSGGWFAVAGALALLGGRRGRRAAVRGILCLLTGSVTVNHPMKLLARRKRPDLDAVPEARRIASEPGSWSFPSGHAISAFSFATGASVEVPRVAAPLLGLAAAVGVSRVHNGAHYPTDVVVGALLGCGIGAASVLVRQPGSATALAKRGVSRAGGRRAVAHTVTTGSSRTRSVRGGIRGSGGKAHRNS